MPVARGVPEIIPVVFPNVNPDGSCPHDIANVYGVVPPLTIIGTL